MKPPRLSIGLPVYNGQNYVAESIDALLHQTYTDFELIISDNASTDRTGEICQKYAESDPRIRYIRQPWNIGAAPNHNLVFTESTGELFKWAAHDDLYGPELLARCVGALDDHPDAVLRHADMAIVDDSGDLTRTYDYGLATDSPYASERLWSLLFTDGGDDEYGIIRADVLRRVAPQASYHNAGRTFVAELALNGPFYQVPERLYFRRDHPNRGDRLPSIRAVCSNLDPQRKRHTTMRLLGAYVGGYMAAIARAPISAPERIRCYSYLSCWLANRTLRRPVRRLAKLAEGRKR